MGNTRKSSNTPYSRPSRPKKRKRQNDPISPELDRQYASTSAQKLKNAAYEDIPVDMEHGYVLLCFLSVFNFISENVKCKECDGAVKFTRTCIRGLGFKLCLTCSCGTKHFGSSPLINTSYEINRRVMFVMRLLGLGLQGINIFCALMDLSFGFGNNIYYAFLENLHVATKAVFERAQRKAFDEEKEKNAAAGRESTHLCVSGDGTWKKRGFSSLFGVASLIGKFTGKVLDCEVKSSFCQGCANHASVKGTPEYDEWLENHLEHCERNHQGSAGKMEVDAMVSMFQRSEELHGVKYDVYIGDGDTKTYKALVDSNPYADLTVQKKECVGHVQKRMGTRLREVKRKNKGVGGKGSGKLTDKLIKDLTLYYGLAIRRHPNSVEDMRKAIWATFKHKCSTDKQPQHEYCPAGETSWCKWRVAEATGKLRSFKHENPPLDRKVQELILKVYEDLSKEDLLSRCTGNNTQNNNESLNSCIWNFAPKHLHCGGKTVEIATYMASAIFNEGYISVLNIMLTLGILVGVCSENYAERADRQRIEAAEMNVSEYARKARIERTLRNLQKNNLFEQEEGLLYGPGIAD